MKRILTALFLATLLLVSVPAAADTLTKQDQTLYGQKTFEHSATFKNDVTIEGAAIGINRFSSVFYVGSSTGHDSGNYGKTYKRPFASIDYAVGKCTADRGDIIYVLPGHAESIVAATSLVCDVAGVQIIGLGANKARPTLTWSTLTTATVAVSANNVTFKNMIFDLTGIDAVAAGFTVTGTGFNMIDCEMIMEDSTPYRAYKGVYYKISGDTYSLVANCDFKGLTTAAIVAYPEAALAYTNVSNTSTGFPTINHVTLKDNTFYGKWYYGAIYASGGIAKNWYLAGNDINNYSPGCQQIGLTTSVANEVMTKEDVRTVTLYADPIAGANTKTLFEVVGGTVEVLELVGEITTIIQAQANAAHIGFSPTCGDCTGLLATTPIGASNDLTGDIKGSLYTLGDLGGAIVNTGTAGMGATTTDGQKFALRPGLVTLGTAANSTGNVTWSITYRKKNPLAFVF